MIIPFGGSGWRVAWDELIWPGRRIGAGCWGGAAATGGRDGCRDAAGLAGIHISVAVKWQHVSSGDWTNYAADISRRDNPKITLPATTGQT